MRVNRTEAQLLSEHPQRSNSTQRQDRVVLERNCWSRSLKCSTRPWDTGNKNVTRRWETSLSR